MTNRLTLGWLFVAATALWVATMQFWFVARTAPDVPWDDQWGLEGALLYPAYLEGRLTTAMLLEPHNEHRVLWTHLLNLGLFTVNGQWDPLVQVFANILLRTAVAAWLAATIGVGLSFRARALVCAAVAWLFLPHLSWHNVQWGFQSQVYFSLGLGCAAIWLLTHGELSLRRWLSGVGVGVAAQFGMAAGGFVAPAVFAVAVMRAWEQRAITPREMQQLVAGALLLLINFVLREHVPAHVSLRAASLGQFLDVLGRSLAWPYPGNAWVGLAANLPLLVRIAQRLGVRTAVVFGRREGEDYVLALGFMSVAAAVAQAAFRAGEAEFAVRVPSRYADFLAPLVLANAWCLGLLVARCAARWRALVRIAAIAWAVLTLSGWAAASAEAWNPLIRLRLAHRDLPSELLRSYQVTGDPAVFAGYRRIFVPMMDWAGMARIWQDERMRGRLPPALQPERSMGPLSRLVRALRDRDLFVVAAAGVLTLLFAGLAGWRCQAVRSVDRVQRDLACSRGSGAG